MSDVPEKLTGEGRDVLLRLIADLVRERDTYAENLTATQARCTELLEEARAARRQVVDKAREAYDRGWQDAIDSYGLQQDPWGDEVADG